MTDSEKDPPWSSDSDAEEQPPSAAEMEAAGQNSMFADEPDPAAMQMPPDEQEKPANSAPAPAPQTSATQADADPAQPYRVLARKYRPQTFSQLIGQEPMVRTLANAIERDRLAHAFLMTGVRGVGKTSTARLIAKALNCVGPDGEGGPTIDPCGECEPCKAIAEGRHIDVIEMDAASNTGVENVREIIEQVRYSAVSARYKIYIVDEVHMLSNSAFNALLKTLEEPPAHVKFLFATTEVDKLPVTVLSRTQRFDLRRIPSDLLAQHFGHVCEMEGVEAEAEALQIIAAAAEGSVRDGLSILDQAIAHADMEAEGGQGAGGTVLAARVRDMLGLADKSAQRRLLTHLLDGDAGALLAGIDEQYALGVEPLALMRALMDLVHRVTLAQVTGSEPDAPSEEERAAIADFSARLKAGQLHRLWQLLLKGHDEVREAPDPLVSLQMALLRVLHAAELPDPGALIDRIEKLASNPAPASPQTSASGQSDATAASPEPAPANADPAARSDGVALDWEELVERVDNAGQLRVAQMMRDRMRVIELTHGHLVFEQADEYKDDPIPDIRDALFKLTGTRWMVECGSGEAQPSLREASEARARAAEERVRQHPLVKSAFAAFPDAQLIDQHHDSAPPTEATRKWN